MTFKLTANNVAKGTLQLSISSIIQYVVIALFYVAVTKTNTLTPADLGVLSILTFIASAFTLFLLNLPTALTKFVSEHLGRNELETAASVQRTIVRIAVIVSLIGLALCTVLSTLLSQYFWGTTENATLVILISISAFLTNLITLYSSGLRAFSLFGKMATVTVIYIISSRVIGVILALLGFDVFGVLIGYVIGSFVGLIAAISFIHGKFPIPRNKASIRPILQFSLPLFMGSLATFVLSQVDIIVIASYTLDYTLVGIYSIAVKSLSVLTIITTPIMTTIFPLISAKFGLEKQGASNVVKTTSRFLSYTIIPCSVILAVIAPTALEFFYGPQYVSGATSLAILSISTIIMSFFTLFTTALIAMGKTRQVLQINLISAFVAVTLLVSFVPFFDVVGAAFARLIAYTLSLVLAAYVIRKFISCYFDREALWKSIIASMATAPFLFVLEFMITMNFSIVDLLAVEILIGGLIYLISLYALKALNAQDFELLRQSFPKSFSKIIDSIQKVMARE